MSLFGRSEVDRTHTAVRTSIVYCFSRRSYRLIKGTWGILSLYLRQFTSVPPDVIEVPKHHFFSSQQHSNSRNNNNSNHPGLFSNVLAPLAHIAG